MTALRLTLAHLSYIGPNRSAATVEFRLGLNVIYGASETGKSFIAESIDFVLGSGDRLSDIKEREGYDRVLLGLRDSNGGEFTLERPVVGGKIRAYAGLHKSSPPEPATVLAAKHNPSNATNISMFLLGKLGLDGKRIRRNADGATNALSFRNLSNLSIISQTEMQKKLSPIETGQGVARTAELSTFKLLLTGVDDSALQAEVIPESERLSKAAKVEVLDELIANYRQRIEGLVGEDAAHDALLAQLVDIDTDMARERAALDQTEAQYIAVRNRRSEVRKRLGQIEDRRIEIEELIERFRLLDDHYSSDLARLAALREAGTLAIAFPAKDCPLCGAAPETQHLSGNCDGNVEEVVAAAEAEAVKVQRLQSELRQTVAELQAEGVAIDADIPKSRLELTDCEEALLQLSPVITDQQRRFSVILERRSIVSNALNFLGSVKELEERRSLLVSDQTIDRSPERLDVGLSMNIQQQFADEVAATLKAWNFPQSEPAHFDLSSRDVVLGGKMRGSFGAGMRALTHAAFTVALLEYTRKNELPHPGFIVLDTPLVAYREPEGDEDDLTGTDVKERFFRHLALFTARQVIVLENMDPPPEVIQNNHTIFFSKNPHQGRYGFFPHR